MKESPTSHLPMLHKAVMSSRAEDNVIQDADAKDLAGFFQLVCQIDIFLAGIQIAGGVDCEPGLRLKPCP